MNFLGFRLNRHYSHKRFTEYLLDFCRLIECVLCDFRRGLKRHVKYVKVVGNINIVRIPQPKFLKTYDEGMIVVKEFRVQKSSDYVQDSYCKYNWISFDITDLQISKSVQSKAQKLSKFRYFPGLRPWTLLVGGLTAPHRHPADKLLRFAQCFALNKANLNNTFFRG